MVWVPLELRGLRRVVLVAMVVMPARSVLAVVVVRLAVVVLAVAVAAVVVPVR